MKCEDTCCNELISSKFEAGFFQGECETKAGLLSIFGLKNLTSLQGNHGSIVLGVCEGNPFSVGSPTAMEVIRQLLDQNIFGTFAKWTIIIWQKHFQLYYYYFCFIIIDILQLFIIICLATCGEELGQNVARVFLGLIKVAGSVFTDLRHCNSAIMMIWFFLLIGLLKYVLQSIS